MTAVTFDDPNLVSCAGLVPVMRLAQDAGLHNAVTDRVSLPTDKGANPAGKVATIVAGMLAGADSIDDLDVARHGGIRSLFSSVYARRRSARFYARSPTGMYGSCRPPPAIP